MKANWIKITLCIYDDEKMKWVDTLNDRNLLQYLFVRFLVQAGRTNQMGKICMENGQPYSLNMLSVIFNRSKEEIEYGLKVFSELGMITIGEEGIIEIVNWVKHQNIEGMEKVRAQAKERVRKYRQRQKEKNAIGGNVTITPENREELEGTVDKDTTKTRERKEGTLDTEKAVNSKDSDYEGTNENEKNIEDEKYVVEIIEYISTLSKPVKGSSREKIQKLVNIHGADNVKIALELASDNDKYSINYVTGILNNWSDEGYPDSCSYLTHKNKATKFSNFKEREYDYDDLEKKLLGN